MALDEDYLLALRLQNELDELEENAEPEWPAVTTTNRANKRKNDEDDLNSTQNLVHSDWEAIDPTPDIFSLFGAFDIRFFQGKLKCVELEWSKRMYQCAGICYQRRNHMGMAITIRLSEPLLKLRSRRDLIETMLHEMIHAYLFIQNIREGNGGHGPNFKRIMENINRVAGTNITVYHTFHDEVALYKTHIWRCNGICQHRKPFYGWVKRTCNRAPGPNDNWWARHQDSCSGTFVKVSQPEPKTKTKKAKIKEKSAPKITSWLNNSKTGSSVPKATPRATPGGYTKMNGGGTVVLKPTAKIQTVTSTSDNNPNSIDLSDVTGGNLRNVVGFRDLNSSGTSVIQRPTFGTGGKILGSNTSNIPLGNQASNVSQLENIRNVWANKFNAVESNKPENRPTKTAEKTKITEATSAWEEIDDDILIHAVQNTIIEINDDNSCDSETPEPESHFGATANETKPKVSIKRELLDDLGEDDSNIDMIDDEFDDSMNESLDLLTDVTLIDELFGRDTLMADFNNINNVIMSDPENTGNPNREIVQCPICEDRMARDELTSHLDGCNGITVKVEPRKRGPQIKPFYKNQAKPSTSRQTINANERELLRMAGYTDDVIRRHTTETQEAKDYNDRIMDEMATEHRSNRTRTSARDVSRPVETITIDDESNTVPAKLSCLVCNALIDANLINQHLDDCLQGNA